jgi:hypothetical protein
MTWIAWEWDQNWPSGVDVRTLSSRLRISTSFQRKVGSHCGATSVRTRRPLHLGRLPSLFPGCRGRVAELHHGRLMMFFIIYAGPGLPAGSFSGQPEQVRRGSLPDPSAMPEW